MLLAYADYLGRAHPKAPTVHLARATADLLIGKGQATEARAEAQKAVDADPHSVPARILLARATNLLDHRAARKLVDELQQDAGAHPRVILTRGFICQADGDFACAEKAFRARLDRTPGQEEASNALARLYVLLGRYDDAGAVYHQILKADPDRVDAELDLAVLDYQVRGDLRGAARRLADLRRRRMDLADGPTAARIRTHSAIVARLQGHLDDADKLVRKVLAARPLDGPGSYQGALLAILQHDPSRARDLAASVSATLDDPARIAMLHALVSHVAADEARGRGGGAEAASADPGALGPVLLATALEGDLGKPRQAYLLMQKVIAIDPADARRSRPPTDYYDGAVAAQVTVKGFEALVKADPQQGLAYAGLGIARYVAGDAAGAKTALKTALSLDDQNVPALVYLGELAGGHGDPAEARDDFSQAVDADHLAPLPQYLLGRVQELQGNLRPAAAAYRRTLRLDPGFHLATVRLALMRARRGDKAGARQDLLRCSPSTRTASRRVGRSTQWSRARLAGPELTGALVEGAHANSVGAAAAASTRSRGAWAAGTPRGRIARSSARRGTWASPRTPSAFRSRPTTSRAWCASPRRGRWTWWWWGPSGPSSSASSIASPRWASPPSAPRLRRRPSGRRPSPRKSCCGPRCPPPSGAPSTIPTWPGPSPGSSAARWR